MGQSVYRVYLRVRESNRTGLILRREECEHEVLVIVCQRVGLGCRVKANCPHVGPWSTGRGPSVGVFLRDPSL